MKKDVGAWIVIGIVAVLLLVGFVAKTSKEPPVYAKGVYDHTVFDQKGNITTIHFRDGRQCIILGEKRISFAPGTTIKILMHGDGAWSSDYEIVAAGEK